MSAHSPLPLTLGAFFELSEMTMRVFDMGRRVIRIPAGDFASFESATTPYRFPFRRHAWCGLMFRARGRRDDPLVWFLKFPLDEQGCLVQASRDYILKRIFEAFGARISGGAGSQSEQSVMKDNPFAFRPDETRLAVFHAKLSREIGRPPSAHHSAAVEYFSAHSDVESWQALGLQGIADFAIRLSGRADRAAVTARLRVLPGPPFVALCTCLESTLPPGDVGRAIVDRTEAAMASGEPSSVVAAGLRGVSRLRAMSIGRRLLGEILESRYGADVEILAAAAGRGWELLHNDALRARYLERLSEAGQAAFDAIVTDLLFMPGFRATLLASLRGPECSDALRTRFDTLAASLRSG